MGFEFFKQYGGQRLNVKDGQPIESGMTTEHLREELTRYNRMLDTGLRLDGVPLTLQDRQDIANQATRFIAELRQRQMPPL